MWCLKIFVYFKAPSMFKYFFGNTQIASTELCGYSVIAFHKSRYECGWFPPHSYPWINYVVYKLPKTQRSSIVWQILKIKIHIFLLERKKGLTFFLILCKIQSTFGAMAEWLKAAVLKTVELRGSEGSNPSCSDLERCESGRIGLPAKELYPSGYRGFESPLLREITPNGIVH